MSKLQELITDVEWRTEGLLQRNALSSPEFRKYVRDRGGRVFAYVGERRLTLSAYNGVVRNVRTLHNAPPTEAELEALAPLVAEAGLQLQYDPEAMA